MDWILSVLVGRVPCQIDVRLDGKRRGFDFRSSVWTGVGGSLLYTSVVAAVAGEISHTCRTLDYGDYNPEQFFCYIERTSDQGVMKLVRLEDAGDDITEIWQSGESFKIRVQTWSDVSCDEVLENGEFSSLLREKLQQQS